MKNPYQIKLKDNSIYSIGDPFILRYNGRYYLYPSGLYPLRGCHPGPRTLGKIRLGDGRGISYGGLLLL